MNDLHDDPVSRLRRAAPRPDAPELDGALVSGAPDRPAPRLVRHGRAARATSVSLAAVAMATAGVLVVAPFGAPDPLFVAAGSGGAEAASLAADGRMGLWIPYEYVAGEGLSTVGGHGTVYELRRTGSPESVLRAAAAALGLDGAAAPSLYSTPEYPSYVLGPEDGSGPSITLGWSGSGNWWYNDPAAFPQAVCAVAPFDGTVTEERKAAAEESGPAEVPPGTVLVDPVPEDLVVKPLPECTQPELPAVSQAPGADEAARLAAALFGATGLDIAPSDIRVTVDEWQTMATASLRVDGVATALEWSVAWSALGTLAWASGHAIEVIDRGGYDTVSPAAGVDRLSDWRWFGAAGPDYVGGMMMFAADGMARGATATSDPDAPVSGGGEDSATGGEPTPDGSTSPDDPGQGEPGADPSTPEEPVEPTEPEIVEPLPEPEFPGTVTLTLEHAEATLLLMWDADGNAWLVPGYAYQAPDQDFWTTIVSLVEGVIQLPAPMEVEPLPAEVR